MLSAAVVDQRAAQAEAAARQYDTARNAALQQYQSLVGARARASLAGKAVDDAVVRSPFAGVVGERLVSVGDFVTRGTKVATVMRIDPLRVELTVPAPFVAAVTVGGAVTLEVDAYPGVTFTGQVRYVAPALDTDSRSLVVEAEVANSDGRLKPGLFATARIERSTTERALMVPVAAIRTVAGTPRVFVVSADGGDARAEERVVAIGDTAGDKVEVTSGLSAGERVVLAGLDRVVDGIRVSVSR